MLYLKIIHSLYGCVGVGGCIRHTDNNHSIENLGGVKLFIRIHYLNID